MRVYRKKGSDFLYDTVRIKSPFLSRKDAEYLKKMCILREAVDLFNGQIIYQLTTKDLEGSFDSRIRVKVDDKDFKRIPVTFDMIAKNPKLIKRNNTPILVDTEPFLIIEGSIHKVILGHNIYGGPKNFDKAIRYLIDLVSSQLEFVFPDYREWMVERIDVSEVYKINFDAIQEWFRGFNNCSFPRREVQRYGNSGLYAQGSTTTFKAYHKGPEFYKHDRKRLRRFLSDEKIINLLNIANDILRIEVEIKQKKLIYDFGRVPCVKDITDDYLEGTHDREVKRMLNEAKSSIRVVRSSVNVRNRLFSIYSDRLAGILLGVWYQLTTLGDFEVKKSLSDSTFYRYKKQLQQAGVSWKGTDVILKDFSLVPQDFVPLRTDCRRYDVPLEDAFRMLREDY